MVKNVTILQRFGMLFYDFFTGLLIAFGCPGCGNDQRRICHSAAFAFGRSGWQTALVAIALIHI